MDKTMEITLVAMVLMLAAVIVVAMTNAQVGGFGDSVNDSRKDVSGNLSDRISEFSSYEGQMEGSKIQINSNIGHRSVEEA
jgi:hypothetical protein